MMKTSCISLIKRWTYVVVFILPVLDLSAQLNPEFIVELFLPQQNCTDDDHYRFTFTVGGEPSGIPLDDGCIVQSFVELEFNEVNGGHKFSILGHTTFKHIDDNPGKWTAVALGIEGQNFGATIHEVTPNTYYIKVPKTSLPGDAYAIGVRLIAKSASARTQGSTDCIYLCEPIFSGVAELKINHVLLGIQGHTDLAFGQTIEVVDLFSATDCEFPPEYSTNQIHLLFIYPHFNSFEVDIQSFNCFNSDAKTLYANNPLGGLLDYCSPNDFHVIWNNGLETCQLDCVCDGIFQVDVKDRNTGCIAMSNEMQLIPCTNGGKNGFRSINPGHEGNVDDAIMFQVYPNPGNNMVNINFDAMDKFEIRTLKIYNSQGQLVHRIYKPSEIERLDVQNWTPGNYQFILLNADDKIIQQRSFSKN